MTQRIDDETLVAYVDQELDELEHRRIEAALASDEEGKETVQGLRESDSLLRAALSAPLDEPLPVKVLETIDNAAARWNDSRRPRGTLMSGPWPAAIAASFVALAIGLGVGLMASDQQLGARMARLEALAEADRLALQAALSEALESQVSGASLAWTNPDSGRSGTITPLRTFKSQQGQWCREYSALETSETGPQEQRAIACREGAGVWKTRAKLVEEI